VRGPPCGKVKSELPGGNFTPPPPPPFYQREEADGYASSPRSFPKTTIAAFLPSLTFTTPIAAPPLFGTCASRPEKSRQNCPAGASLFFFFFLRAA